VGALGSEEKEELGYQLTYYTYVASMLLYTQTDELVVGWTIRETLFFHSDFLFTICWLCRAHM